MNTNETKMERKKINHEIHLVSNYRALLIAKHIGTLLLILYFVPAAITGFDESPALYILLLHNILPAVFYLLFTNNSKSHTKNPRILKPSAYDEVKEEPKKTHTLSFILLLFILVATTGFNSKRLLSLSVCTSCNFSSYRINSIYLYYFL